MSATVDEPRRPLAGLVLLGGASRRMGQNKALLPVAGVAIIERVIHALDPLCSRIFLVGNDAEPYLHLGLPIIPDVEPNLGPLMGLYSGLLATNNELNVLLACDMPFASRPLMAHLLASSDDYDVVIPRTEKGLHPLCAVYRRSTCLPAIRAALDARSRRVISFFDQVRVREIGPDELRLLDPDGVGLMNVNTPEELAKARAIAAATE
ncbi:MAG TPA: molybdenum cofactor guanylyltransferase [Caldilineae bacterium]|nr:molybdenum cofactor guanylyltransferase [Caldilineae bacterium]